MKLNNRKDSLINSPKVRKSKVNNSLSRVNNLDARASVKRRATNANSINPVESYLSEKYDFRYNIVTRKVEYRLHPTVSFIAIEDYELNSLVREIRNHSFKVNPKGLKEILHSNFVPRFDPIREYFNNLPAYSPNEGDYIQQLIETVNVDNPEFCAKYLKKWLVSLVNGCVNFMANQMVLVFIGSQGIGKSSWIRKLVPEELSNYIYEGSLQVGNKDTDILLTSKFLINLDEMDNMVRGQSNAIKTLITKQIISLRRPYGYYEESLPRRASFCGSLNHKNFLTDPTGNRRFLCFEATSLNYNHTIPIDRLYAQAIYELKNHFVHWLTKEDIEELSVYNKAFEDTSDEEGLLIYHFRPCSEGETPTYWFSASEVLQYLKQCNEIVSISDASKQAMGKSLIKNGFKRIKKRGRYVYELILISNTEG